MTAQIKTVQYPKLILIDCTNQDKISKVLSDILNSCSFNTCIDGFSEHTDFVIAQYQREAERSDKIIPYTVVFDEKSELSDSDIEKFQKKVSTYEYAYKKYGDENTDVLTYSPNHYSADVTCRNVKVSGKDIVFEIIRSGILSRVHIKSNLYSVEEVLLCTAVLTATGIPLASVIGYFNKA